MVSGLIRASSHFSCHVTVIILFAKRLVNLHHEEKREYMTAELVGKERLAWFLFSSRRIIGRLSLSEAFFYKLLVYVFRLDGILLEHQFFVLFCA